MSRYIDAESLKDFFFSETSGTEDTIYDCVIEAGLEEFEDEATALCHKMIELFHNVIDTEEVNQWISVEDRKPEDEKRVLMRVECRNYGMDTVKFTVLGVYIDGKHLVKNSAYDWEDVYNPEPFEYTLEGWWEEALYNEELKLITDFVTHWMPLPEPPQED